MDTRPLRLLGLAFVTGFSGAIMPGPLLLAVIGQTVVQGFPGMFWLVVGHALLELVTVALLVAGLQAVIARPRVRGVIGVVGGAALAWMGCDMFRSVPGLTLDLDKAATAAFSPLMLILWGAGVCAANPYFTGWWATIGVGQMATMAPRNLREYLGFYLGHEASDFTWYTIVALIIVTGRRWLTDGLYHGLVYTCAVLVALLGVWFLVTGVRFILGRVAVAVADVGA
jgi:threonine/homoserine/homoserine lactone efflux protein